jgi:hypothetical protein
MFSFELLKNHAGVLLCGDFYLLNQLHEVVHEVNNRSPIITDKEEGAFLGLAYDVRKAFQGERRVIEPPKAFKSIGVRYGVEILWPVLLVQARWLRGSLGYMDSTKRQQAISFALEAVIQDAVREDFPQNAAEV